MFYLSVHISACSAVHLFCYIDANCIIHSNRMNRNIQHVTDISQKVEKRILGLMSGTSLDGLDLALCRITGNGLNTKIEVEHFTTITYSDEVKAKLRSVFSVKKVDLEQFCILNSWLGNYWGEVILHSLKSWDVVPESVDAIASPGQTVYHAPLAKHGNPGMPDSTLQIGDGDHIAVTTGILTISDFRQKHTAAGGQGAPMAIYEDYLLFHSEDENRFMLNIGGIANFTFLPARGGMEHVVCTDSGPGNTLIDNAIRNFFPGQSYDENGQIAASGTVHAELLNRLMSHPYFEMEPPATTGPEMFSFEFVQRILKEQHKEEISPEDLVATLTRFTAESIAHTIQKIPVENNYATVYVSGGGANNATLMRWISELLPGNSVKNFNVLGMNPDAKEAALFALLANETLSGNNLPVKGRDGNMKEVSFGKISLGM